MSFIEVLSSGYIVGKQHEKGKGKGRHLLGGDYGGYHPQLCTIELSFLAMANHLLAVTTCTPRLTNFLGWFDLEPLLTKADNASTSSISWDLGVQTRLR
jgi:hypothetical protein